MLEERTFKPKKNQLLYHYCTSETFNSICTSKSLRLSDLFSMNDFLEFQWGYEVWKKAANQVKDEVSEEFLKEVDGIISSSTLNLSLLASCFSLEGDVLSQWRAYADDGCGYCIGFDAEVLLRLPINALKILYDKKKQLDEVSYSLKKLFNLYKAVKEEGKYDDEFFFTICVSLSVDLAALKNPAFKEEKEVRLLHILHLIESNDYMKLSDQGGVNFGETIKGKEIKFKMSKNSPVPYLDYEFTNNEKVNPIREVILGPKNESKETAISIYLETLNIPKVTVKKSLASYR